MLDRETMEGYGRRGWFPIAGAHYTRDQLGRETASVPHMCLDPDPYRTLPREGARHPRFRNLRLKTVEVDEEPGISSGTFIYVDQRAFDEAKAGRYPRGLIDVGETPQAGQTVVTVGGEPITVMVSYMAATRVYRYYSGLEPDQTQPSGSPPFTPTARVRDVSLGDMQALVQRMAFGMGMFSAWYRGLLAAANSTARFDWDVSKGGSYAGGYWVVTEQWVTRLLQEPIEYAPMRGGTIGG